jgi:hypothetical protein
MLGWIVEPRLGLALVIGVKVGADVLWWRGREGKGDGGGRGGDLRKARQRRKHQHPKVST